MTNLRLYLFSLAFAFLPCLASAQQEPAGHWEGVIKLPDRDIPIAVDLAKDNKGAWAGLAALSSQNISGVPLTEVRVDGKSVKFRVSLGGVNVRDFDCILGTSMSLECVFSAEGGQLTASMQRKGEAKADLPWPSAVVSKTLEGDWEGTLNTPNGAVRVVVRFRNQPDNTVKATLDSSDQNSTGLPLTDIVQRGAAVEFRLRMANGAYKGALNKEGTELAGEWSQGGMSLPLVFKKSAAE